MSTAANSTDEITNIRLISCQGYRHGLNAFVSNGTHAAGDNSAHAQYYCRIAYTIRGSNIPQLRIRTGPGFQRDDGATPVTVLNAAYISDTVGIESTSHISKVGEFDGTTNNTWTPGPPGLVVNANKQTLRPSAALQVDYQPAVTLTGTLRETIVRINGQGPWSSERGNESELLLTMANGEQWKQGSARLLAAGDLIQVTQTDGARAVYGERREAVTITWTVQ